MTKRRVTIAVIIGGLLLTAILGVLADPVGEGDCFYSGETCVFPLSQCQILGIGGFAKTCLEVWWCPEQYVESCGTCICVVF